MEGERQAAQAGGQEQAFAASPEEYEKLRVSKGEKVYATNGYIGDLVELLRSKETGRASHAIVEQKEGGTGRLYLPVELIWDTEGDEIQVCVSWEEASQLKRTPPQFIH